MFGNEKHQNVGVFNSSLNKFAPANNSLYQLFLFRVHQGHSYTVIFMCPICFAANCNLAI